jgi:hypothetical protein
MQARRKILAVMQSNRLAPQKVAALFEQYLAVLDIDIDSYVADLLSKDPEPSLEDIEDILQDLNRQAEDVRLCCANTVRTGIYRSAAVAYHLHT